MKRKNRERTIRRGRPRNIAKKIVIASFIFLLIGSIFYLKNILRNLDYFRVKDIVVDGQDRDDFSYFKGRNIFDIDITREAQYLSQDYPNYKRVKIIRVLPNRIFIEFVKRSPLAILKLYRLFSIDEELVLFETGNESAMTELPLITGLETKIFGPKVGTRYSIKELVQAAKIIEFIQNNRAFQNYRIKTIEAHNPNYLSCFISIPWTLYGNSGRESSSGTDILEARFSQEDLQDKLDLLARLFNQIRAELGRISYIDLRFKEPVIKYRDDKK